jgi:hypothetical protein
MSKSRRIPAEVARSYAQSIKKNEEGCVRNHIRSTPLPVIAVCLAALAVTMLPSTLPGAAARAADDCAAAPNAPPPSGQHWWYRTDRANKRKCWYLGPKDLERAAAPTSRPAAAGSDAARPAPAQEPPPAPVAHSEEGVQSIASVQEGVPFLVDWTDLLKEAGIVSGEGGVLKEWAGDDAARTAWAMRAPSDEEPVEAHPGKDDARAPQPVAARSDVTGSVRSNMAATPAQMPLTFIAALSITGGLCLTIFGILRRQRRLNLQPDIDARAISALERAIPKFLQQHDARPVPSGREYRQEYGQESVRESVQAYDQDYDRAYGGEDELRRILGISRRRAA